MRAWRRTGAAVVGTALAGLLFSAPSFAGDERTLRGVQRARVNTMKSISRAMRRVKVHVGKENFGRAAMAAEEIALLAAAIPYLTPKGSAFGETRIKAEAWSRFDDYGNLAARSSIAAENVAKAAKAKDKSGAMEAFAALGQTCGACHRHYRKKKER